MVRQGSPKYLVQGEDQELQKPLVSGEAAATTRRTADPQQPLPNGAGIFSIERKQYGGVRVCQRCLRMKPDRTHHCSQCHRCVLKMDHHCDWVGNCIGYANYKYFLNTLFFASLSTILIVFTSRRVATVALDVDSVPQGRAIFIVVAYVLSCVLAVIITLFFGFHLWLTANQYTTIEYREKRSSSDLFKARSPYDLGTFRNLQAVLGNNPLLWCMPCFRNREGEGVRFEVRPELRGDPSAPPKEKRAGSKRSAATRSRDKPTHT